MKPLKKHIRETKGLCGPASLKILLSHYGKEFTESELAKLCAATAEEGTDHVGLVKAVESLGEKPIVKSNATIEDLRYYVDRETPVIVGYWSGSDEEAGDHYAVVYEITNETISMMDSQLGTGITTFLIEDFEKVWYDLDGPENKRVDRWMLAIPAF